MKIAVCLPSFNEASTIGHVAQVVDQGLSELSLTHHDVQAEILNFDSNSKDGTHAVFLDIQSIAPKHSFIITDGSGKGGNILEFCKYVVENNIDYCLTIDSDIVSITPKWITTLLEPLIFQNADYVTPIYKRSRFEGSSTNHFAFPIVYALTGCVVRQPIAGDFAFTNKIARELIGHNLSSEDFIHHYGIDIFMTIIAISLGNKVIQVDLGKKIHAQSFHKLEHMFPQIATAALMSFKNGSFSDNNQPVESSSSILTDINFPHKNRSIEMKGRALIKLEEIHNPLWCPNTLIDEYLHIARSESISEFKMSQLWVELLTFWIQYYLNKNLTAKTAEIAGSGLLPFFILRAVNFWLWAEKTGVDDVERAIQMQAEKLRSKVKAL